MHESNKDRRQKILAEIVKDYVAIVDGPGCFFVQDWIEMFPDAKVHSLFPLRIRSLSLHDADLGLGRWCWV
jgi:hypothetical protein